MSGSSVTKKFAAEAASCDVVERHGNDADGKACITGVAVRIVGFKNPTGINWRPEELPVASWLEWEDMADLSVTIPADVAVGFLRDLIAKSSAALLRLPGVTEEIAAKVCAELPGGSSALPEGCPDGVRPVPKGMQVYTEFYDGVEECGGNLIRVAHHPINSILSIHDDMDREFGDDSLIPSEDYVMVSDDGWRGVSSGALFLDKFNDGVKNVRIVYIALAEGGGE